MNSSKLNTTGVDPDPRPEESAVRQDGLPHSEHLQVTSSISSALLRVREKMSSPEIAPASIDGSEGVAQMSASGSWFRRLWHGDEESGASVLHLQDGSSPVQDPERVIGEAPAAIAEDAVAVAEDVAVAGETGAPSSEAARVPGVMDRELQGSEDQENALPVRETESLGMMDEPEVHTEPALSQAEAPLQPGQRSSGAPERERSRPPRPLSYQELAARTARVNEEVVPAEPPPSAVAAPSSAPTSISAARRAAGQPAANPFDRPSLYRPPPPPTDDQNFNDAFTTPPSNASRSGRWDPIPTLRPSGWRDSGSYRAATGASQEEPWDWTSGATPPRSAGWTEAVPPVKQDDDSELILTRQWGLLSRFQQSRGLGLANRRATSPGEKDSGSQDDADSLPEPNRRKG